REVAMQLLAQAVSNRDLFGLQLVMRPAELSQLNEKRVAEANSSKCWHVGAQRVCKDQCVPSVVFRASDRMPVSKPVELLRIDRENAKSALEQCLDHGASGN